MVSYEGYMQIKILRKQGKSLRAIASELGCSINPVRKYFIYWVRLDILSSAMVLPQYVESDAIYPSDP
jgi:transposase